jgi:hypothetical protein
MEVKVRDKLAALRPAVDHKAISLLGYSRVTGKPVGDGYHVPHQWLFAGGQIGRRLDVLPGNHEKVYWGIGIDIGESDHLLVLVEDIALDLPAGNAAEDTVHCRNLLSTRDLGVEPL